MEREHKRESPDIQCFCCGLQRIRLDLLETLRVASMNHRLSKMQRWFSLSSLVQAQSCQSRKGFKAILLPEQQLKKGPDSH